MFPFYILYIAIFLCFLIEKYVHKLKKKRVVALWGFSILFLFIGLRAESVGADTTAYVSFFHDRNFWYGGEPTDIAFEWIGRLLHLFNDTTGYFIFMSSAIMCIGIFFIIYKLSENKNLSLLLFCLVGTSSIFLFLYMSMIRQACALTFYFFAIYLLFTYRKKQIVLSVLLYVLAVLTHGSMLFTLPFVFVLWKWNIAKKVWIALIAVTYVMAASRVIDVGELLSLAFLYVGGFTSRDYSAYSDVSFGVIEQSSLFNMNLLSVNIRKQKSLDYPFSLFQSPKYLTPSGT